MSKTLIIGDIHTEDSALTEIFTIFETDILLPIQHTRYDRLIQCGDFFHHNQPTPATLKFVTALIQRLKNYFKEITVLTGTGIHDNLNGVSIVEYFDSLGVKVIKGDLIDNNILYGHWMVKEARDSFGTGKLSVKELSKYKYVFLGHQHTPEQIGNVYQLGSIRYVSFGEVGVPKYIALLEDNNLSFIPLVTTIPMIDVTDLSQLEQINPRTKVRVIFNSFEDYKKNASYVNKIGKKFFLFKILMNFQESKILIQSSNKLDGITSKSNIIKDYIEKIEDKDVRQMLEQQFKENI